VTDSGTLNDYFKAEDQLLSIEHSIAEGRFRAALSQLETAEPPLKAHPHLGGLGRVMLMRGICLIELGKRTDARAAFEAGLIAVASSNDHALASELLYELAALAASEDRHSDGQRLSREALLASARAGCLNFRAGLQFAVECQRSSNYDLAYQVLVVLASEAQRRCQPALLAKTYTELGLAAVGLRRVEEAARYLLASIQLKKSMNDNDGLRVPLMNLKTLLTAHRHLATDELLGELQDALQP
jgi:tetratricopeptide (TPR) repeat protein